MLEVHRQSVDYTFMLNLTGRLGILILSNPDKLTTEQKTIILEYIEQSNSYRPPYGRIKWAEKYYSLMVPKLLDNSIKNPWDK